MGISFREDTIDYAKLAILLNNLGRRNDSRGGDSWGVCKIDNGEINVSHGLGLIGDHAWSLINSRQLFAHTRFKTTGGATIENAHPFSIGNVVGAHNGCISNHYALEKKYNRSCSVDSMHLFHHLNEGRNFHDVEGYGAIEWVERDKPDRINLCRLKGGSLAIFGIGDPKEPHTQGVVWSSDEKHILEALYTAGVQDFFPYKVEEAVVYFVADGEIYVANGKKLELNKETTRSYQQWVKEDSYPGYMNRQNWSGNSSSNDNKSSGGFHNQTGDRDLTDWKEWLAYCEEQEEEVATSDDTKSECGIVTTETNVVCESQTQTENDGAN